MLELGVDEFTLVLQLPPQIKHSIMPEEWQNEAEHIIARFEKLADFESVYGERQSEMKKPQGYTTAYTYGNHSFYFAMAYHHFEKDMGVIAKFSAQSWDFYLERTGLQAYQFLQKVQDSAYSTRLSRIDLTADYIDEGLNVNQISQGFAYNKICICREYIDKKTGEVSSKKVNFGASGFFRENNVSTFYLGSRKSITFMRIYDKKLEQIEQRGSKYEKAINCSDWVRFEGVFRDTYAHQISEALMSIKTDNEYASFIASTLVQKYRFVYVENGVIDCETEYTQMLLDTITNQNFVLKAPSSRNYELARSLQYLIFSSGAVSTLYKVKVIWGNEAVEYLREYFEDFLDEWEVTTDCRYWLNKHAEDYKKSYPKFDDFKNELLSLFL